MTTITLTLPDDLAEQAQQLGLLSESGLRALIESEVRRQRQAAMTDLLATAEALQSLDPPLTQSDIDDELLNLSCQ